MDAIAFYLPQYHAIPENDAVYGKGFTEWDNVRQARAFFPGHYQPRPHASIGYYNLLDEKFLILQHRLAYENGVKAFCYYYYNFAGKRLLERPLDLIADEKRIENKFCLCWAHPSWYNNRDNKKTLFLEQHYSPANAVQLLDDLERYFEKDRYILIDGKPLLTVFAPERNPEMKNYVDIWRERADKRGYSLWIAGLEAYAAFQPSLLGLDSMIEFAPDWNKEALLSDPSSSLKIFDYPRVLRKMLEKPVPNYIRNRCVFPGWDNTPRWGANGALAVNADPKLYKLHLDAMCEYTRAVLPANMQYVFINAWNEWGEGCALEPDVKYAYAYLNNTREVLSKYA